MSDLSQEFKSKLISLFKNKEYSRLEFEIEKFGNINDLPKNFIYLYSISIALNPGSNIEKLKKANFYLEKIYLDNHENLEILYNFVTVSLKIGSYEKILHYLKKAHKFFPQEERIIESLAKINFLLCNVVEAIEYYELLFSLNDKKISSKISYLVCLNYASHITQDKYFSECKKLSKLLENNLTYCNKSSIDQKEKISLGFLSSDFKKHSVSYFLKGVLKNIDNQEFKLTAFSNLDKSLHDNFTNELKKNFDEWHDVSDLSNEDLIKQITTSNIDILIDLNIFTFGNRIEVFSQRVAPIQISWLGYCNTAGIENIDYLISDKNCINFNEENFYSEKVIYMPKIWNAMSVPDKLPNNTQSPCFKKDFFTFGSFNNFSKLSDDVIHAWSKILKKTNSKIILKNSVNHNKEINKNIINKFKSYGINENKLIFKEYLTDTEDHLKLYNEVDLSLDTFPYNGVTTSFESYLMGVPVITLKGHNFNSRCGESINKNVGMVNLIALNLDDYIDKSIFFATNYDDLKNLRKNLRQKVLASPLFDVKDFVIHFSNKIKEKWEEHLKE